MVVWLLALTVCGWSLLSDRKPHLFGSETIRRRLTFPHWLVISGALASFAMVLVGTKPWLALTVKPHGPPPLDFLPLATVLVLCMLFGFVAFEAGAVSSAYRDESCQKNLLVMMFSLASYLGIGRVIFGHFAPTHEPILIVFQAAFACTVSLIISNALTERASTPTNVLCAIVSAGLGYPLLAGLVWGNTGALLREIGFVDASGASTVHLFAASASLTAAAAVGPRARIQRWQFLDVQDTPAFSSPWAVVGGLFLMFGWLGFNSGTADSGWQGHAFFNTTVGACSGALAAWLMSWGVGALKWQTRLLEMVERHHKYLKRTIDGLEARPRIVIGMMGGLVAVTANGALPEVNGKMTSAESFIGGFVAVFVSALLSACSPSEQIDDPLGVIGTHGCAAIVGILFTAFWIVDSHMVWRQFIAQLIGCGACVVAGWVVAMVPCFLLLRLERWALVNNMGSSWTAVNFRLRLGAVEQLGTTRETPLDQEWNLRIEEARHRIIQGLNGNHDEWWEAVKVYATAAEMFDKKSQADIAHEIVASLDETARWPEREKVALVALASSEGRGEDVSSALQQCLSRANGNGNGHAAADLGRKKMLVWSASLLTERAAASAKVARPEMPALLVRAQEGLDFLRKVTMGDKDYEVRDLARVGIIDSSARLFGSNGKESKEPRYGKRSNTEKLEQIETLARRSTKDTLAKGDRQDLVPHEYSPDTVPAQDANVARYMRLMQDAEWYETNAGKVVGMVDGTVVCTGDDLMQVLSELRATHPTQRRFVKRVERNDEILDVPTPLETDDPDGAQDA